MQSEEVSSADVANMMQGLLDRQAIQDVISCYSLGQDSHQGEDSAILQQWEETFSETGTVDYSVAGGTVGSYRDLAKWMRGDENTKGSMSGFSNWQHMLSLPLVSIAGDTAHARTDFFATHRGRADQGWNVHYNATGAFHDDLVRTPKGWRIQFRRFEVYFGDPLEIAKTA
jgi:SnoaL-like domain